ncbi:phosphate acyltransferase PlsX [Metamycoplasma gateae]|uniref:Phosphate acyltransferase n=1 Tax=Metamycoplasma gateae TaxID=35769 RepID=A0ABZ2AGN0_9BACT|nr:phosphate acyltransferase PlsX [Metamycoplasma gateae]
MKRIVFDVLNNDGGIVNAVYAALTFKSKNKDYELALVGDKKIIVDTINSSSFSLTEDDFIIIDSSDLVHIDNNPRDVLKRSSSMLDTFKYLKENDFDAILSSGDSGALLTLSTLLIKRLPNVVRPAFMPILPTLVEDKNTLLLDAGANIETSPEYLNSWAIVATEYYKLIFNKENPTVGLLNIGTEEYKGSANIKEAFSKLKDNKKISFYGFIEPKNAIAGDVDIILAEGQSGNIFLKTLESSFLGFGKLLKSIIHKNIKTKIGGLLLKKDLKKFKERFDYRNVGGAFIIGLDKIVVKAHGGSDEIAFENALNQIKFLLDKENFINNIAKNLEGGGDEIK